MKSNILSRDLCLALVCLGSLSEAVFAASPPAPMARLGARLRVIESAVAEQRVEPLMQAALARELFQSNSPQEPRWNAAGQVQVYMHYDRYGAPPSGTALRALGATDIVVSSDLGLVQAWVPALQLNAIAALPEVVRVTIPRYAYVKRAPREGACRAPARWIRRVMKFWGRQRSARPRALPARGLRWAYFRTVLPAYRPIREPAICPPDRQSGSIPTTPGRVPKAPP